MNIKYIYIHGIHSGGFSSRKAEMFKNHYGDNIYVPDYTDTSIAGRSSNHFTNLRMMCSNKILEWKKEQNLDQIILIGSSAGGYYATNLVSLVSHHSPASIVLINPLVNKNRINTLIEENKLYAIPYMSHTDFIIPTLVALDIGDTVLDYREAEKMYKYKGKVITYKGGNHSFIHMKELMEEIEKMVNNTII